MAIPIIDLAGAEEATSQILREACTVHGFFFVSNHGVPPDIRQEQFEQSRAFFALPEEVKLQSEAVGNRGYTRLGEQTLNPSKQSRGDTKESYYICKPEAAEGSAEAKLPFHGPNRWPAALPGFRPAMEQYMNCVETAFRRLLRLITRALDLPQNYFDDFFDNPILTLRPIHYSAEPSNVSGGVFGAGAHTDWGFFTFVDTNNTPGLEIFQNGTWIPVPCLENLYVVNIGDMLQRWSNDRFKSTLHRVVNRTPGQERYSCAYFVSPQYDAKIECLPSCKGNGAKFKPVMCADYLSMKYKQTHQNFTSAEP